MDFNLNSGGRTPFCHTVPVIFSAVIFSDVITFNTSRIREVTCKTFTVDMGDEREKTGDRWTGLVVTVNFYFPHL